MLGYQPESMVWVAEGSAEQLAQRARYKSNGAMIRHRAVTCGYFD